MTYSFDAASEAIRTALIPVEADALIDTAVAQATDSRSAASLAREFGLDDAYGLETATQLVAALQ